MSVYKIRIPILLLTPERKKFFLQWAVEGFRLHKIPTRKSEGKAAPKVA